MTSTPRKRAEIGQLQAGEYGWAGKRRSKSPQENLEYNSTGDRGAIVGKAARGRNNR